MNTCQSLRYPSPWPPPVLPQSTRSKSMIDRMPIIGWLIEQWRERHRRSVYLSQVLMPIQGQIVDQLRARPHNTLWSQSPCRQRIAEFIETAVAEEKGLASVTIHPDDPIELLFWGAEDDLSALRFALRLQKECGIMLSTSDLETFVRNHMTVSEVIESCLRGRQRGHH